MTAAVAYLPERYPTLEEMGVTRFDEISGYSLRQVSADKDILKINYKREKGSFLPVTRKYKFGRAGKAFLTDGGRARTEHVYEISPFLLKAVNELDRLTTRSEDVTDNRARLLAELAELEQLTQQRITALRAHIEKM